MALCHKEWWLGTGMGTGAKTPRRCSSKDLGQGMVALVSGMDLLLLEMVEVSSLAVCEAVESEVCS